MCVCVWIDRSYLQPVLAQWVKYTLLSIRPFIHPLIQIHPSVHPSTIHPHRHLSELEILDGMTVCFSQSCPEGHGTPPDHPLPESHFEQRYVLSLLTVDPVQASDATHMLELERLGAPDIPSSVLILIIILIAGPQRVKDGFI